MPASTAERTPRSAGAWQAWLAGAAEGAAAAAGVTLLLYTGQGLVRAAGLLTCAAILGVAAGLWAGAPEDGDTAGAADLRLRWFVAVAAFVAAGGFAALWTGIEPLQQHPAGGAAAVLLLVGLPAYVTGSLLAGMQQHRAGRDASIGPAALAGGAIGVFLSTGILILSLQPWTVFVGCGVALAVASMGGARRPPQAAAPGTQGAATAHTVAVLHAHAAEALVPEASALSGRVVLVTGVSDPGQAGFTIAAALLGAGAAVVITARRDSVHACAAELGGAVSAVQADLSDAADVDRLIGAVNAAHGRLDAVVNVAGGLRVVKPFAETTADDLLDEVRRNATTALIVTRAALPLLRAGSGTVIGFGSPAIRTGVRNLSAYGAGKAALTTMLGSLAAEEREHGIRVHVIWPGMLDTAQNLAGLKQDEAPPLVPRSALAALVAYLVARPATDPGRVLELRP